MVHHHHHWTALIDEICEGRWINPLNGKRYPPAPLDKIVFADTLKGREADLVTSIGLDPPFAVVCDPATYEALGERVAAALSSLGSVTDIVLERPHADMATVRALTARLTSCNSAIAVGAGTINDLTKFASLKAELRYAVFATAGSMNGYTSSTASITLDSGLKVSLPAQVPAGFFVDLEVAAAAPAWLNAAGFGDCLCRSVAQIDWWMSHRLLGTRYHHEPYIIEIPDEICLMEQAVGIATGDIEAIGRLFRVLTLGGLGITFTGVSNHCSMGEHQISHYIDCFAGNRHPGSTHGQQVGVATLTMARLQQHVLASDRPPEVQPTRIDLDDMTRRMGRDVSLKCLDLYQRKALDQQGTDAFNEKLRLLWPHLRNECLDMAIQPQQLHQYLAAAGGPTTAADLGLPVDFYREAVCHGHEMRDRFSFTDIAANAGILHELATKET